MADNETDVNDWTVMFFFAGDNALSPLIVSQVKAIKEAGFQKNTDVLVHFDSNELGAPTRIFHVNQQRKKDNPKRPTEIGDGKSSFVRNMRDDILDPKKVFERAGMSLSNNGDAGSQDLDTVTALDALKNFLDFCHKSHRAKNYMLFLVGHGLIVGNDAFLPDEHPVSAISLEQLDKTVRGFTDQIAEDDPRGTLQLLALHSCGMSAVEVAYQLQGTAKFMMGSEGISYIGSWPYRQILKKLFNTAEKSNGNGGRPKQEEDDDYEDFKDPYYVPNDPHDLDVERLVEKLYFLSIFYATDYMLTGYSLDLSLCSLDSNKFEPVTTSIQTLVANLKDTLKSRRGQELILLAHWESQSYWDEMYTDLFDFCHCLRKRCELPSDTPEESGDGQKAGEVIKEFEGLAAACDGVMERLATISSPNLSDRFSKLVIHSEQFGPLYQYSHGLSIYFPWARPVDDDPVPTLPVLVQSEQNGYGDRGGGGGRSRDILARYGEYKFTEELGDDSWLSFLEEYFKATKRQTRKEEDGKDASDDGLFSIPNFFNPRGTLSRIPVAALTGDKTSPSTGPSSCTCPSIKNYPTQELEVRGKSRKVKAVTITDGARQAF
jgi:hypothetical protein